MATKNETQLKNIVKVVGTEELGYSLLGCYLYPSDMKYFSKEGALQKTFQNLGARERFFNVFYHRGIDGFSIENPDKIRGRVEKTKQRLEKTKNILEGSKLLNILEEFKQDKNLGYIVSSPFRDAMFYNHEIEKKYGAEKYYEAPEYIKKEFITFEDAISRNPEKYNKVDKVLEEITSTLREQLVTDLTGVPLSKPTFELVSGGSISFPIRSLKCPYAINEFFKLMKITTIKEAEYDKEIDTLRLTDKGADFVINESKKVGFIRDNNGRISLTVKGAAFVNEYFKYWGGGGG